jgi:hypothetical protein
MEVWDAVIQTIKDAVSAKATQPGSIRCSAHAPYCRGCTRFQQRLRVAWQEVQYSAQRAADPNNRVGVCCKLRERFIGAPGISLVWCLSLWLLYCSESQVERHRFRLVPVTKPTTLTQHALAF